MRDHVTKCNVSCDVWCQVSGFRYDDERLQLLHEAMQLFSESCSLVSGVELDVMPWLRFLPNNNFRKLRLARHKLDVWIDIELARVKVRYSFLLIHDAS